MSTKLKANWFAPARGIRSFAVEMRHRSRGWWEISRHSGGSRLTNFGDELAPLVLREATGRDVEWAPFGREDVNVIGSNVVHYARQGGQGLIWGMGVHDPVLTDAEKARIVPKVLAIRGPNSRDHVGLAADIPLGDPGLLATSLKPASPRRWGQRILIAHFSAFASSASRAKMREYEKVGFEIVMPDTPPLEIINRIATADFLACSGLHGTIIAHAVGTPTSLITFSDSIDARPAYKYIDYFASVGEVASLTSWRDLIGPRDEFTIHLDAAQERADRVSEKIAPLVDGLYRAAAPLRSAVL